MLKFVHRYVYKLYETCSFLLLFEKHGYAINVLKIIDEDFLCPPPSYKVPHSLSLFPPSNDLWRPDCSPSSSTMTSCWLDKIFNHPLTIFGDPIVHPVRPIWQAADLIRFLTTLLRSLATWLFSQFVHYDKLLNR